MNSKDEYTLAKYYIWLPQYPVYAGKILLSVVSELVASGANF